jgi:hypothetical protein
MSVSGSLRAQGASVHLTMDRMTRLYTAISNLGLAVASHPELEDAIDMDGNATEAQTVAKLSSNPAVVAALRSAGLTPREYVETTMAYMGASMAYGLSKTVKDYKIPASADAANVAFVRDHAADIAAMQKRMEAAMRKAMPKEAAEDTSGI